MKSSRICKGRIILLAVVLIIGIFSTMVLADSNGLKGKGTPNQLKNQNYEDCTECLNNGGNNETSNSMGNKGDAPDDDGDGVPNGQDNDYILHNCDDDCDGTCVSEPKGSGLRRNFSGNNPESISEYRVNISGRELRTISVAKLAQFWGVDANKLLEEIKNEFKLTQEYNIDNTIDDLRGEYKFSPYQIKELAEKLKQI